MTRRTPPPDPGSDAALAAAAARFRLPGLNTTSYSPARVANAMLGGDLAWTIDLNFIRAATGILPAFGRLYRDERAFRNRAVEVAVRRGIRQFLDLGSGLPFPDGLHQRLAGCPGSVTLYVDIDPYVVAYLRMEVEEHQESGADGQAVIGWVQGDLLTPGTILFADQTRQLLDLTEPICLVATGILDTVSTNPTGIPGPRNDDVLAEALRCFTDRMAPGSLVVVSHTSLDGLTPDATHPGLARQVTEVCASYQRPYLPARALRDTHRVRDLLGEVTVLDPGVVPARAWPRHPIPDERGLDPFGPSLCLGVVAQVTR
ncbi:SAM-dependent methyltransferase [Amycolatopsis sp. PS_44_ISF1]|uniref:SAM-dependent methyltransferase n=1 Tax=Amycolatopsis sp. PS_44_ISF1 TaxID=2974917 RepID=UPI0028DFE724|nr:SAM-dependent methyltransferase [Amycolatopsis sp. PS_44_ISF1]MDT8913549.1 SAM-dependent methyltransferase [Amycolatopsis sp. PS_44_ISF1]